MRSQRSRGPRRNLIPLSLALLVPALLGSATHPPSRSLPDPQALPGVSDRASLIYAEAASAIRDRDCAGAFKTLAPLTGGKGRDAAFAKLLTGFYAHACGQASLAEDRLYEARDPDGLLEDWRLFALSSSALEREHVLVAQAAIAKLLGDYPASVLRPRALLRGAQLAWERRDSQRALELVDKARRENLRGLEATDLERLAWEIGTLLGDEEIRREAARRLLADSPSVAAELKAIELFRGSGEVDWGRILTAEQLERRAQALLALKLDSSALAALDAVPVESRDLEWYLLKAEALTRVHQGDAALTLLSSRRSTDPRQSAALEWARAQAAEDVATAQRGRDNLPTAERQRMRRTAQQHLRNVAQIGADRDLAIKSLRSLYADQAEDDLFEASIETLRALRRIDPADTTGASNLWNRGWREYGKKNFSSAVGYWTELYELYPRDSAGRRGRYWTGRAFEALGETERSQQIFREVASSDTTDFYRKNALARLAKKPANDAPGSEPVREPWPSDPLLARARLLTDIGLESLAATEMELVRPKADPRSMRALEALVLARKGDRRKSMLVIRDAFPALGGPFQAGLPDEARKLYYPIDYEEPIRNWASRNRLPVHLVYGVIRQESGFDPSAQSWAGARGLMQLMPGTAREWAGKVGLTYSHEKLSDPDYNVRVGTTYLSHVLDLFDGNLELALAGYNGGPYRIKRMWKEWGSSDMDRFLESLDIEESKTYVKRILVLSDSYRQIYPLPG
ncbi:MAG TPA: transglycosylase SLT domain-containing protein [Thermoanaerobaculia bacterium]